MLVIACEQVTQSPIPSSFPELTVVVAVTECGALVGVGMVGFQYAPLLHLTDPQGDVLA